MRRVRLARNAEIWPNTIVRVDICLRTSDINADSDDGVVELEGPERSFCQHVRLGHPSGGHGGCMQEPGSSSIVGAVTEPSTEKLLDTL